MSLRRAGTVTLQLLRSHHAGRAAVGQLGQQPLSQHLAAVALPALVQRGAAQPWGASCGGGGGGALLPGHHSRSWQQQQSAAAAGSDWWLRHLVTTPERKQEEQQAAAAPAGAAAAAARQPAAAAAVGKPLPGAQDCDDAIESYTRTRSAYHNLAPPSSYRTASQRVMDAIRSLVVGTVGVLGWCAAVPGKLWGLRTWSRDDWSVWWAGIKKATKDEAHHYWVGFKLLAFDARVASGLAFKAMRGNQLTRRERRQLTRTTADMFRLVPMIIILVIPFMELALPLLLKLFPNMLPSTFEDKLKKEEEVKKRLVIKMEVAKFLQDTVAEMAKDIKAKRTGETSASAAELYAFINRVRAGAPVSNDDLIRFASLFNDELTLDNLDRVQLVSMCQLLGIPVFGTDSFLRNRLRSHLAGVKQDDRLIQSEGLDSLTEDELRTACKTRGMKAAYGRGAKEYMVKQMQNWLDLSLNHGLPSSLMLLSRAFTLTSAAPSGTTAAAADSDLGRVRETLLTLPEEVIKDVGLEVAAPTTSAEDLQKRLLLMQKEQKLIQEEAEAAQLEAAASQPATMAGAHVGHHAASDAGAAAAGTPSSPSAASSSPRDAAKQQAQEQQAAEAQAAHAAALAAATAVWNEASASALKDVIAAEGISQEQRDAGIAEAREQRMQQLLYAITVLASSSGVATERARFMGLVRQQISALQETHGTETTYLTFTGGGLHAVRPEELTDTYARELVAPRRLEERVNGILLRLEKELDQADEAIGERLHVLDLDNDGLISATELSDALRFLKANLDEGDLTALLERLEIKAPEGGSSQQPVIPVAELIKLAEGKEGGSSGSSSGAAQLLKSSHAGSSTAPAAAK